MKVDITYRGINLSVSGDYSPPESEVRYYPDGSGYPGSSSEFDIQSIFVEDTDIMDLLDYDQIEEIREMCIDKIEN